MPGASRAGRCGRQPAAAEPLVVEWAGAGVGLGAGGLGDLVSVGAGLGCAAAWLLGPGLRRAAARCLPDALARCAR